MRDLLELQIIADANQGDTTVLADLLSRLPDDVIYNALGDREQMSLKTYYELHLVIDGGYSTTVITDFPMDDDEIILKCYEDDILHGDDHLYIDYIQELSFEEWDEHFNFNKK